MRLNKHCLCGVCCFIELAQWYSISVYCSSTKKRLSPSYQRETGSCHNVVENLSLAVEWKFSLSLINILYPKGEGGILFYLCPSVCPSVLPSVQDIFRRIFLSNCWWEVFFDPSDSYFLFAEERGYHRWALAHSSSCCICYFSTPAYAAALGSLLRQYKSSFKTYVIPCYIASGKCGNPGELPYRLVS